MSSIGDKQQEGQVPSLDGINLTSAEVESMLNQSLVELEQFHKGAMHCLKHVTNKIANAVQLKYREGSVSEEVGGKSQEQGTTKTSASEGRGGASTGARGKKSSTSRTAKGRSK